MRIRIDGEMIIEVLATSHNFNLTIHKRFQFSCCGAYIKTIELLSLSSEAHWNSGELLENHKWSIAHNFKRGSFVFIPGILVIGCLGNIL